VSRPGSEARHHSRQVALQVLFAADLAERGDRDAPAGDEVFDAVAANFELPERARPFARELVGGVVREREALDCLIAEHARNWRVDRMAAVDRNILRLAAYELVHTQTPASVVLDEAIELAHRFGDDPSPGFVNGVLDAVARAVRGEPGCGSPAGS
jgi:N utilization substance protein B